jgi:hypothetical protein
MSADKIDDHFIFIYELEPSELCTNFRFDSPNLQRADLPETASFSVWKNMLVVFYAIHSGAYAFDVLRERAHYFATIVVSCYGWLTRNPIELVRRNWVEVETEGQARKKIAGTFRNISDPPVDHPDNEVFKKIVPLIPLNLGNIALARALNDYHSCLSKVNPDFYFYAYRAVEDIRSHFGAGEGDDERKKAWDSMNKALSREQKDYKELFDLAKQSRHANILGAVLDRETVQRQVNFVGSLLSAFIEYISLSSHVSKPDSSQNPAPT